MHSHTITNDCFKIWLAITSHYTPITGNLPLSLVIKDAQVLFTGLFLIIIKYPLEPVTACRVCTLPWESAND